MNKKQRIPCIIMRGGTSKGLFFLENDLPADPVLRDQILLTAMGSPDPKQINGLGGATSVTSKVAIVSVSQRPDADVDYLFAQVSVDKPVVSYKGNCGNILSAVGPFAVERGLVKAKEPLTTVRIYNVNTGKVIESEFAVENGSVKYDGDYAIAGVKGTASPVRLKFLDPAGTISDELLPTGNVVDELDVPGVGKIQASIVDAANPLVFVKAADVGLVGNELPAQIEAIPGMLDRLEKIRGVAAVKVGLLTDYERSAWDCPGLPKMTLVAETKDYTALDGALVKADEIDLLVRMMSMQKPHPAIAMTGVMCTAAACALEGSIAWQVLRKTADSNCIRMGHAGGIAEGGVSCSMEGGKVKVDSTTGVRTANLLMVGDVFCC